MYTKKIPHKDLLQQLQFFQETQQKYEYRKCGNSVYLINGGITYYAVTLPKKEQMPINQLYFIKKVKEYIISNNLHEAVGIKYKSEDKIKFLHDNKKFKPGMQYSGCWSVDLTKAYWVAALRLGYLNQALYDEGLKIHKTVRLACLGTFAKTVFIYKFNGIKEKALPPELPTHPQVFFNCAHIIYRLMEQSRLLSGDNFLFFWTDGIYVRTKAAADKITEYLAEKGYASEMEYIPKIARKKDVILTYEKVKKGKEKGKLKPRLYNTPYKKFRKLKPITK